MGIRTTLEREQVIQAIFMEMPYRLDGNAEDRRTAERIYKRVFVPLLMIDDEELTEMAKTQD